MARCWYNDVLVMKGNLAPGCIWKIRQEHDFLIFQRVFPPRLFAILGFTQNFKPALFLFDSPDRQTLNFKYKKQTLFLKSMIKNTIFLIFLSIFPLCLFAILGFAQNFKTALFLFDSSERQTMKFEFRKKN
jgi:hypothetical protein